MAEVAICADIGTSSLKAAAIDTAGNVIARSRVLFLSMYTDHAAKEWICALSAALKEIHSAQPDLTADVLCISGNGPTIVADDAMTLLWNTPVPQQETESLFLPRVLHFKQMHPDSWNNTQKLYSGPEYLIHQLTGVSLTILPEKRYSSAYWTAESLEAAGLTAADAKKLPPFAAPGDKAGTLTKEACSRLDSTPLLKEGTAVYCGAPDFVSALVGTNTLEAGKLCDRAGSSEGVNLCTSLPLKAEDIRTLPSIHPQLWNASFLLPDTGLRFSAFKQRVEREQGRELDFDYLVQSCIMSDGTYPAYDQGKYLMLQIAMQVRDGIAKLLNAAYETNDRQPRQMVVTGGQAANDAWNQMKANVTGLEIVVPYCTDAELMGDAAFAFTGMGLFDSVETSARRLFRPEKSFLPEDF